MAGDKIRPCTQENAARLTRRRACGSQCSCGNDEVFVEGKSVVCPEKRAAGRSEDHDTQYITLAAEFQAVLPKSLTT